MASDFLLYGATGFVGAAAARLAVRMGLRPVLAGRDAAKLEPLAAELGVDFRVFGLDDPGAMDGALGSVPVVLHCAGPYGATAIPMLEACFRTRTHYLDLTGELPVLESLASREAEARARGIMLLPAVGFDVVPTDCLAVHLHHRLRSATRLTLAFHSDGPAGFPPGTQRTAIDLVPFGNRIRRDGRLVVPRRTPPPRTIDFGQGPRLARWLLWGDLFTAFRSTGIPDIDDYAVQPDAARRLVALAALLRPLFRLKAVRRLAGLAVTPGPTPEQCARTVTHVWGEAVDADGRKAVARLHGPEAGLVWTTRAALAVVRNVLAGHAPVGFQTPGLAYGADFVLECEGVTREDVPAEA